MTALASRSAPSTSSNTLALCLDLLSRAPRVPSSLSPVAPPSPAHDRRRRLPPTSPSPAAFLPLTWLD